MYAKQFGAIYGLLAFALLIGIVGAYKGLTYKTYRLPASVASKHDVQAALGQSSVVQAACKITVQQASQQGVILTSCTPKSVKIQGNTATVKLEQKDSTGTTWHVTVHLVKGLWQVATFNVG